MEWGLKCNMSGTHSKVVVIQCFMHDQIIASRTCFGGHTDVNC